MTEKQSTTARPKYSLSQRLWQVTIGISISLLIYFVIARFYYDRMAEEQRSINHYFNNEIKKVDQKITEIKDLNRFRREYVELMHLQSNFQEVDEKNNQYLSEIFKALPFLWSVKQIDILPNQTLLTFEVLNSSNLESGINRLNNQLDQYQVSKISEQAKTGKNYREIEIEIKKLNRNQVSP